MVRGNRKLPNLTEQDIQRFWIKVDKRNADECWPWLAGKSEGYGGFWLRNYTYGAHRVVYFLTHGVDPLFACHRCDNPPCCNPAHIFDGTAGDNAMDRDQKQRQYQGEAHHFAKLSALDKSSLVADYHAGTMPKQLTAKYNVSETNVYRWLRKLTTMQNRHDKLTKADVRQIRIAVQGGATQTEMARQYNVSVAAISWRLKHPKKHSRTRR